MIPSAEEMFRIFIENHPDNQQAFATMMIENTDVSRRWRDHKGIYQAIKRAVENGESLILSPEECAIVLSELDDLEMYREIGIEDNDETD